MANAAVGGGSAISGTDNPLPSQFSLPGGLSSLAGRRLRLAPSRPATPSHASPCAGGSGNLGRAAPTAALVEKSVNTIRFLAIDAVEKANSGHPGLPMECASIGHVLLYDEVTRRICTGSTAIGSCCRPVTAVCFSMRCSTSPAMTVSRRKI